jgi:hypothetical protein
MITIPESAKVFRSRDMSTRKDPGPESGTCPAQSSSTWRLALTAWGDARASNASTTRSFTPTIRTFRPSESTSSGPNSPTTASRRDSRAGSAI